MQDDRKAVWSIQCVSAAFFPSLKENFIAYSSSKVSSRLDCIFEIDQLWQSGFSRVHSNCCYSCSFEPEIINIGQLSHKMYSNNIVNSQESTTILNACTKKAWKLIECTTYPSSRFLSILLGGLPGQKSPQLGKFSFLLSITRRCPWCNGYRHWIWTRRHDSIPRQDWLHFT